MAKTTSDSGGGCINIILQSYEERDTARNAELEISLKMNLDNPYVKRISNAISLVTNEPPVLLPTLGGSLPLFVFEKVLHTSPVTVPIANHDNNQHAENENIKLKNFFEGIELFASMMTLKN